MLHARLQMGGCRDLRNLRHLHHHPRKRTTQTMTLVAQMTIPLMRLPTVDGRDDLVHLRARQQRRQWRKLGRGHL